MSKRHKHISRYLLVVLVSFLSCIILIGFNFCVFQMRQFIPLIPTAPRVLGFEGKQTYLILFQNNAELRPGGGFIGSYALATVDKGRLTKFTVHNVYDADGLLKKHIEPYYISRRYLQVHLYMRDSNFDVDFARSAQQAASLLYAETGQHVDGIVAIDLSFVRSLIGVLVPLYIPEYNETMDSNNFFILTETHADKYSFNGSTQKQDYLRALSNAIKMKLQENRYLYYVRFIPKILEAIPQKHLLIASTHPTVQSALTASNVSSTLTDTRKNGPGIINDFFGVNEANIGVNKANYYLRRRITHTATIAASGTIVENVQITYTNMSKYNEWPTGGYKAYLRLILPLHATILSIAVDGKTQHLVPAITDYKIYEAPGFVAPDGLEVDNSEEEGKTIYGFIVTVPIVTTRTVTISYQLPDSLKITAFPTQYNLYIFKQPGTDRDPYTFTLNYPSSFTIRDSGTFNTITKGVGSIKLSSPLSTDQDILITLSK